MREYQAVYANVNGWGIQQASSDLPADAAKSFTDLSTTLNRSFSQYKDLYQGAIDVLHCDGKYAFRVQAVNDRSSDLSGRSTVRTHGFIFPLAEQPAFYRENARLAAFSAQNFSDHLREEPLVYDEPLPEIAAAMAYCGLDSERLERLLRCIYALLLSGSNETLHIRIPDQSYVSPCMMCIYQGLPYSIRQRVSYSNVPMTDGAATVSFLCPDFPEINLNPRFFDLLSGEENVLDASTENELEQHIAFHHYVCMCVPYASQLRRLLEDFQTQEEALHIPAQAGISVRLDLLQLIYQMRLFEMRDSSLTEKDILLLLMRLLNLQLESEGTDQTLIHLLHYCDRTQLPLNERIMAAMQKKYGMTKSDTLKTTIFEYNSRQLLLLGKNDLCRKLFAMYQEDKTLFHRTAACMQQHDGTPDREFTAGALDLLYADYIGKNVQPDTPEKLNAFYAEITDADFSPHPFTDAFLKEQMLQTVHTFAASHSSAKAVFSPFWHDWLHLLGDLVPNADERAETVEFAKEAYWSAFRMQEFTEAETDFYRSLAADPEQSEHWQYIRSVIDLLRLPPDQVNLRTYCHSAVALANRLTDSEDREHMIGVLIAHARQIFLAASEIDEWILFLNEMTQCSQQVNNFYSYVFMQDITLLYENAEEGYLRCSAEKSELTEYQRLAREYAELGGKGSEQAAQTADALKRVSRKKFGLFRKKS